MMRNIIIRKQYLRYSNYIKQLNPSSKILNLKDNCTIYIHGFLNIRETSQSSQPKTKFERFNEFKPSQYPFFSGLLHGLPDTDCFHFYDYSSDI